MKPLKTLIKLAKSEVEERQKSLAETVLRQDKILAQKTEHENKLATEALAAKKNPEIAMGFGTFVKATLDKIEKLQREIDRLQKIIDEKREHLREAFAEQKRYEIALDIKIAEQTQKENRLEQIKMDELAVTNFIRKNS